MRIIFPLIGLVRAVAITCWSLFAVGLLADDSPAPYLDEWSVRSDSTPFVPHGEPKALDFVSTLTRARLIKTPAWRDGSEYPPLSPRKAEEIAREALHKIMGERRWEQPDISLKAFDVTTAASTHRELRWIYVLNFRILPVADYEYGSFNIIVLMDGTAIEPKPVTPGTTLTPSVPSEFSWERELPPQISVSSNSTDVYTFRHQMPWGILGKRLGTQIVITGEAKLPNALWVDQIDSIYRGSMLLIEIRGIQLRKGIHYTLEGYEAGEFSGVPAWVHSGGEPFQYRSFFVVTKAVEPKAALTSPSGSRQGF